jgi:hypothetical protein
MMNWKGFGRKRWAFGETEENHENSSVIAGGLRDEICPALNNLLITELIKRISELRSYVASNGSMYVNYEL